VPLASCPKSSGSSPNGEGRRPIAPARIEPKLLLRLGEARAIADGSVLASTRKRQPMPRPIACPFGIFLIFATTTVADEFLLRSGGRLTGDVAQRNPGSIVVELEGGQITLPTSSILEILPGPTTLSTFRSRAGSLAADDAKGWLDLGLWARSRAATQLMEEALDRVLRIDPENAAAHRALRHVQFEGRWMTPDEAHEAMGDVVFEGRWVKPEQRDQVLHERAVEAEIQRAEAGRAEAEARARTAEARVAEAEAHAREAVAQARAAADHARAAAAEAEAEAERHREEERFRCRRESDRIVTSCFINGRPGLCVAEHGRLIGEAPRHDLGCGRPRGCGR